MAPSSESRLLAIPVEIRKRICEYTLSGVVVTLKFPWHYFRRSEDWYEAYGERRNRAIPPPLSLLQNVVGKVRRNTGCGETTISSCLGFLLAKKYCTSASVTGTLTPLRNQIQHLLVSLDDMENLDPGPSGTTNVMKLMPRLRSLTLYDVYRPTWPPIAWLGGTKLGESWQLQFPSDEDCFFEDEIKDLVKAYSEMIEQNQLRIFVEIDVGEQQVALCQCNPDLTINLQYIPKCQALARPWLPRNKSHGKSYSDSFDLNLIHYRSGDPDDPCTHRLHSSDTLEWSWSSSKELSAYSVHATNQARESGT